MKEAKMRFCRKPGCIISSAYGTLCVNRRLITKRPLKKSNKIQKNHMNHMMLVQRLGRLGRDKWASRWHKTLHGKRNIPSKTGIHPCAPKQYSPVHIHL